jgi:hypothetical protein
MVRVSCLRTAAAQPARQGSPCTRTAGQVISLGAAALQPRSCTTCATCWASAGVAFVGILSGHVARQACWCTRSPTQQSQAKHVCCQDGVCAKLQLCVVNVTLLCCSTHCCMVACGIVML